VPSGGSTATVSLAAYRNAGSVDGIAVVGLFAAIVVFGGYYFEWKWTGFPKRTPWDWVDLLIVPIVLALGGYLFTRSENRRAQRIAERQRDVDREIAQQQAETDRRIAEQRSQDDTLQAYLDQMGQLLLDKDRPLRESKEGYEVRTLARAWTLTVLTRLDGERKARVVQFLHESGLLAKRLGPDESATGVVYLTGANLDNANLSQVTLGDARGGVILSNANLRGANLSNTYLGGAHLDGADLRKATLRGATLTGADLSKADLRGADLGGTNIQIVGEHTHLTEANLRGADLGYADLSNAYLGYVDLRDANLRGANLRGAALNGAKLNWAKGWTGEQLFAASSLSGATMPDGQVLKGAITATSPTFEEWLKSRSRGEEGENSGPS
jgi:uncharacterized protein YjbI with pentapeptide repeats